MEHVIQYRWVKKLIGARDGLGLGWYLKSPGYIKLDAEGAAGLVAFKFPVNQFKPEHLDWCTEYEVEKLEKYDTAFVPKSDRDRELKEALTMFPVS